MHVELCDLFSKLVNIIVVQNLSVFFSNLKGLEIECNYRLNNSLTVVVNSEPRDKFWKEISINVYIDWLFTYMYQAFIIISKYIINTLKVKDFIESFN